MSHDELKPRLLIYGASGHGRVVADIVALEGRYILSGFVDDDETLWGQPFCDSTILGGRALLGRSRTHDVIVAVGNCLTRVALAATVEAAGLSLGVAVHPRATIANGVPIGMGTVVAAGAVVNPGAQVGRNVIVNTGATVDHDCVLEDGAHICPGVHLAGDVRVGRCAWVGIGSTVIGGLTIGAGAYIGAGSVVVRDIAPGVKAYGVPARSVN